MNRGVEPDLYAIGRTGGPVSSGEVVWVMRSSTGIGRAATIGLAQGGCNVTVHYNSSEDKAREITDDIEQAGGEALLLKGDVSDSGNVKRIATGGSILPNSYSISS